MRWPRAMPPAGRDPVPCRADAQGARRARASRRGRSSLRRVGALSDDVTDRPRTIDERKPFHEACSGRIGDARCRPRAGGRRPRAQDDIPLPEHPRPDFERAEWVNLNGTWQFRFDPDDVGLAQAWHGSAADFPLAITVPFPWGSRALRRPRRGADRLVRPHDRGPRGLAGTARLPGRRRRRLAHHGLARRPEAGRAPGRLHALRVRADAARASGRRAAPGPARRRSPIAFKLEGKQGYGNARGIWQTPYLEARGAAALADLHFSPDIDAREGHGGGPPARGGAPGPDAAPDVPDRRRGRGGADGSRRARPEIGFDVADSRAASLVAGRSVPLRGRGAAGGRARPGRGPHLLRHAQDHGGGPAGHRLPLRHAQRRADLPAAGPRPGLPSRRLLHLPERRVHA